jgi:uncharacterized protein YecE (DUF72 family)|tara:strand:+ start:11096 stop:11350 length:255 start_codon:yes stop_codon:yes gene_type:complete
MGHHFNHNPSLSMNKSTLNNFADRLGQKKGKNKIKRIDNLILNFHNYYLDHSPKHINRMILELKNNNNMTFEEASIIATNEIGI